MLDEDDPEAVAELLKYLYTLSDLTGVTLSTQDAFDDDFVRQGDIISDRDRLSPEEVTNLEQLWKETKCLTGVVAVAEKYCVTDLVASSSRRIGDHLTTFQSQTRRLNVSQRASFVCAGLDALYFHDDIPALRPNQKRLIEIITSDCGILTDIAGIEEMIRSRPWMGWDLLKGSGKVAQKTIERQGIKIRRMVTLLPRTKRKYFEMND